jgi:hypothetical protein
LADVCNDIAKIRFFRLEYFANIAGLWYFVALFCQTVASLLRILRSDDLHGQVEQLAQKCPQVVINRYPPYRE